MTQDTYTERSFSDLNLDARLVSALEQAGMTKATLIQEKAVPFALLGKDILARAKTGSGKTFAYLLPILHQILILGAPSNTTLALVLVPTRELANQLEQNLKLFVHHCLPLSISSANLAREDSRERHVSLLKGRPQIIISTPSRLANVSDHVSWSSVKFFAIDEADYIFSFGYAEDLDKIIPLLPKVKQSFLMSATLSDDLERIKSMLLRNAVILKLEMGDQDGGPNEEGSKLTQFVVHLSNDSDKFLLAFAVFKLALLKGKMIVFVRDVERAYKLRIFLEEFGIRSCCVNPDFPLSCRQHIVEEFNKGVYDIIIAPDYEGSGSSVAARESGVVRGVDFRRVDVVINFDMPLTVQSYIHRVGRTARAGQTGTAVSFVDVSERSAEVEAVEKVRAHFLESNSQGIETFAFDMSILDGFRYRMSDALRAVTKAVIRETQLAEIKRELHNSEKLKALMPNKGEELSRLLRHDRKTAVRQQPHLKHVPEYLLHGTKGSSLSLPQSRPATSSARSLPKKRKLFKGKKRSRSSDPLKTKK